MRRIGMKGGKRRKSDTSSDADSGENGGSGGAMSSTRNNEGLDGNNVDAIDENAGKATSNRKKSRSRGKRDEEPVAVGSETENADDRTVENTSTPSEQENGNSTKTASKKRKREKQRASTSQEKNDEDREYEVEKVVAHRTIKGRRQFLVRWKGYGDDSDTWEQEKDLNCPKLIESFLEAEEDKRDEESVEEETKLSAAKQAKVEKKAKKSPGKKRRSSKGGESEPYRASRVRANELFVNNTKKQNQNDKKEEDDEEETGTKEDEEEPKEFEVEKIVEVHFKKNKAREFLIRWKGFAAKDDTWEPEENLNCPELIAKFMEKVEKAKTSDLRELRTNPAHTKRYTLTTHESGRRWSRRNVGKQRTTYYQCDE